MSKPPLNFHATDFDASADGAATGSAFVPRVDAPEVAGGGHLQASLMQVPAPVGARSRWLNWCMSCVRLCTEFGVWPPCCFLTRN